MGVTEIIPGLDPREPKTAYFCGPAFDQYRFELGRAVTIGEQHAALEGMFLAAKVVTIGTRQFDMMPRRSSAHNRDIVPAIYDAGVHHSFSWLTPLGVDSEGMVKHSAAPRLATISLPRIHTGGKNLRSTSGLFTTVVYDFEGGGLSRIRTADQCNPKKFSYLPDHKLEGTVFDSLGVYIRQLIASQLVVIHGKAYLGKPETPPNPVPYADYEMAGVEKA